VNDFTARGPGATEYGGNAAITLLAELFGGSQVLPRGRSLPISMP
jgi:hypothetical protein